MRSLLGTVVNLAGTNSKAGSSPPVPYADTTGMGLFSRSGAGVPDTRQLAGTRASSTLFGLCRTLYESVGSLNWRLYRSAASGAEEDRTEVTKHAAIDLINKPNQHMTRTQLFEQSELWLDLTGEAIWVIERLAGMPIALWPVRPDRMEPVPSEENFLAGWIYTAPNGSKVPLLPVDVIQFKLPHPDDPYRGLGPVQALLYSIDNVRFGLEWNRNFFRNSAAPGGIVSVPQTLDDDSFRRLVMRWRESHQGVSNGHRVGVLEGGATWTESSITQRDMQFSELIALSRDMIHEAFSFPRSMTGQTDSVNRANAETGEEVYARWLVVPRGQRFRDSMNHVILPQFGAGDLEFDFDSPIPESEEQQVAALTARSTAASVLVAAGYDAADVLEAVGLPDMSYEKPVAPVIAPEPGADPGVDDEPTPNEPGEQPTSPGKTGQSARSPIRVRAWLDYDAIMADTPPQSPHTQVDLTQVQEEWTAALGALMALWPAMLAAWSADLVRQVRDIVTSGALAKLGRLAVPTDAAAGQISDALQGMAATAGRRAVAEAARQGRHIQEGTVAGATLDAIAEVTAELLAGDVARSAGGQAMLTAGQGVTAGAVGDAVALHLAGLSDATARQSFGGALTAAQNHGRFATFAGVPAPEPALYADERMDANTCARCREVNGRWLGNASDMAQVWKTYPNGGYVDCLGGNRCRGTVTAVYRPETTGE